MNQKDYTDWHDIVQSILDEHLWSMSGKIIKEGEREFTKYFEVDYHCLTEGDLSELPFGKKMVLPFDHLKEKNLIEYKSINETIDEKTFRYYVGRALFLEGFDPSINQQNKVTLTILTTMEPKKLISNECYQIERINKWKFLSRWIKDLDIYILVIKGMRGEKAGEALAFLQILDDQKNWRDVFDQDLDNVAELRKITGKIGKEISMNLVREMKKEGKKETAIAALKEGLDISFVSKITGLSKEEVTKLKEENFNEDGPTV